MKTKVLCPHCEVALVKSPVEHGVKTCMNDECAAVYVVDNKGNVVTDSLVL